MADHRMAPPRHASSAGSVRLTVALVLTCGTWLTCVTSVNCAGLSQSEEVSRGELSLDNFFAAVTNKTGAAAPAPDVETTTPLLVFPDPSETLVQLAGLQSRPQDSGDGAVISSGHQDHWSFSQGENPVSTENSDLVSGQNTGLVSGQNIDLISSEHDGLASIQQDELLASHEDLISVSDDGVSSDSQNGGFDFTQDGALSSSQDEVSVSSQGGTGLGQISEVTYSDGDSTSPSQVGIASQTQARGISSSQTGISSSQTGISSSQLSPSVSSDCVVLVDQVDGVLRPTEGTPCLFRLQRRSDHCSVRLQLIQPGSLSCDQARLDMDGQPLCDQLSGAVEVVRNFTGQMMSLEVALGGDTEPRHGGLGLVVTSAFGAEGAAVEPAAAALPELRFRQEPCGGASGALTASQLLGEPDIPPTGICFQEFSRSGVPLRVAGISGQLPSGVDLSVRDPPRRERHLPTGADPERLRCRGRRDVCLSVRLPSGW